MITDCKFEMNGKSSIGIHLVGFCQAEISSFGHNENSQFLWNMAAQRKFVSQTEQEELLKNFINNLSDDSVNEYSSESDDSK